MIPPPAFLDFHRARQRFQGGLWEKDTARIKPELSYKEAGARLSQVLPSGSRLFYAYPGDKENLQGVTFAIENQNGNIAVSSSSGPAR